jgi:hypothetical protein
MKIEIIHVDRHRNGICGAPFDVALFRDAGPEGSDKLAILFEQPYHCAVLDVTKVAEGDIRFLFNSWRGDRYEPHLRRAIKRARQKLEDGMITPPDDVDLQTNGNSGEEQ